MSSAGGAFARRIDAMKVRIYHQATGGGNHGGPSEVSIPLPQRYAASSLIESRDAVFTNFGETQRAGLYTVLEALRETLTGWGRE